MFLESLTKLGTPQIDDGEVVRTCYPAMRHAQGDTITPRDCILLKSGPRKTDLPFVAKVAAMWENPDDGKSLTKSHFMYFLTTTIALNRM